MKNGKKSFRAYVRVKGHPRQCATFKRKTDAVLWAQKTEAEIRDGKYFATSAAKRHTLAEIIDRYKEDVLPNKKPGSARAQSYQLDWWKEQIGPYSLDKVTPALIVEYRDKLAKDTSPMGKKVGQATKGKAKEGKKRSPATVARFMAALSHVFTVAVKEWQLVDDNPFRRVTKPRESRGVVRFLSDNERERLLKACKESTSKDLYLAVVIALSTGCRKAELMTLRWHQVDINRGLLTFDETKNDERRSVPLVSHALELMKERSQVRRLDTDLVFPGRRYGDKPRDLTRPWKTALEASEVKDFRWHDLRHSCASYLVMNGATPSEVAEVLGHKTLQMVKRYAHLSEAHSSKVVTAMNEKIFS
jgi:integrase